MDLFISVSILAAEKGDWWEKLVGRKLNVWDGWPDELLVSCPELKDCYRVTADQDMKGLFQLFSFSLPEKVRIFATGANAYSVALPKKACKTADKPKTDKQFKPSDGAILVEITRCCNKNLWYNDLIGKRIWVTAYDWPVHCHEAIMNVAFALQVPLCFYGRAYILYDGTVSGLHIYDDTLFIIGNKPYTLIYKSDCKRVAKNDYLDKKDLGKNRSKNEQLQLSDSNGPSGRANPGKGQDRPVQGPRVSSDRPKGQVRRGGQSRFYTTGQPASPVQAGISIPVIEVKSDSNGLQTKNDEDGRSSEPGTFSTGAERVQG